MMAAYRSRHEYVVGALNALPGFECRRSDGAFYAFPRVTGALEKLGLADDTALVAHLLQAADVAMVPGSAFGAPGYVRISFACSMDELQEAIRRMGKALM